MQKWIFFVLFIAAGVLGLGVLFQNISDRQAAQAEETSGSQLKIVAHNWAFDQTEYKVTKGEALKISFVSKEGVHALHIAGNGVDIKLDRNTPSQQFTFDKPGTYDVECVLPCGEGHATMKSKLVVQ
jgi:cytochrome c oxidase subunit II